MPVEKRPFRKWRDDEVAALLALMEEREPGLLKQIEKLELAGGDLGEAWNRLSVLIRFAYPDVNRWDQGALGSAVRARIRKQLGFGQFGRLLIH